MSIFFTRKGTTVSIIIQSSQDVTRMAKVSLQNQETENSNESVSLFSCNKIMFKYYVSVRHKKQDCNAFNKYVTSKIKDSLEIKNTLPRQQCISSDFLIGTLLSSGAQVTSFIKNLNVKRVFAELLTNSSSSISLCTVAMYFIYRNFKFTNIQFVSYKIIYKI